MLQAHTQAFFLTFGSGDSCGPLPPGLKPGGGCNIVREADQKDQPIPVTRCFYRTFLSRYRGTGGLAPNP